MSDAIQFIQGAFYVDVANVLEAVRTAVGYDDGCNSIAIPTLAELPSDGSLNQVRSYWTFDGNFPALEAPTAALWSSSPSNNLVYSDETNWVQPAWSVEYSNQACFSLFEIQPSAALHVEYLPQHEYPNLLLPTLDWVISPNGEVVTRRTIQPEPAFNFSHELVRALDALAAYVAECDRLAHDLLRRLYRKFALSSSVSKNGQLCVLASDRRVRIETAARDQVLHLEVITLAEEHEEAPGSSALGQILTFGEGLCKRMKRSSWNLLSGCSEKALYFGSISVGPSAVAA
jgi:hypothetical protein